MTPTSFYVISDIAHNLHLTLVPAFRIHHKSVPKVEGLVENISTESSRIKARVHSVDYFTGGGDVAMKVNILSNRDLIELHHKLWLGIKALGGVSERPNFIEHNYLPHITSERDMIKGSEVHIKSLRLSNFSKETRGESYSSKIFYLN